MSDRTEKTFHEQVREYLIDEYGNENIEHEKYLEETGRYADFWIDGPLMSLAVEVENDWEAVMKGIGQSILYAAHEQSTAPVVVVPKGHVEYPEVQMLREKVTIVELDV